ncbi:MAG: family 1 glycosylhydrolase [Calothrix sp. SM1_5_4]|nr:family 1 glycosylhydrolase [Calothrix sp. SM1_5_4]
MSDLGWEIYVLEGFYRVLKAASQYAGGREIIVTENGIADSADSQRPGFLRDHLLAMHKAIQEGVRVSGYCHWSLLDNFEWAEGYEPRFGLFETDYVTLKRHMRPSGRMFAMIAESNSVTDDSLVADGGMGDGESAK